MQEQYAIYKQNKSEVITFITETISNIGSLEGREADNFKKLFKIFPSLELAYICDNTCKDLKQISQNIYRKKTNDVAKNRSRRYLFKRIKLKDKDIDISKPYISSATGHTCITIAKREGDKVYFFDFNLVILLQRLELLEIHKTFSLITKTFYTLIGVTMMILAIFTIGYSGYEFIDYLFIRNIMSIESIFKPVIALTLGLAIFDLSKTVLEQEVIFKSYSKNNQNEYRVLIRFSITIIVALLIESLMVVFKIAIENYANMIQAFYLIGSISLLVVSLAFFIKISSKK